ncbi:MAG: Unknown protein, partial [uncultured Aureispira sp.]
ATLSSGSPRSNEVENRQFITDDKRLIPFYFYTPRTRRERLPE